MLSNPIIFFLFISIHPLYFFFFFLNDPAPPEIYPLPLHDPLPIPAAIPPPRITTSGSTALMIEAIPAASRRTDRSHTSVAPASRARWAATRSFVLVKRLPERARSEEHTSELQSLAYLVCRLLLETK